MDETKSIRILAIGTLPQSWLHLTVFAKNGGERGKEAPGVLSDKRQATK